VRPQGAGAVPGARAEHQLAAPAPRPVVPVAVAETGEVLVHAGPPPGHPARPSPRLPLNLGALVLLRFHVLSGGYGFPRLDLETLLAEKMHTADGINLPG
jgi:hypothetical protein